MNWARRLRRVAGNGGVAIGLLATFLVAVLLAPPPTGYRATRCGSCTRPATTKKKVSCSPPHAPGTSPCSSARPNAWASAQTCNGARSRCTTSTAPGGLLISLNANKKWRDRPQPLPHHQDPARRAPHNRTTPLTNRPPNTPPAALPPPGRPVVLHTASEVPATAELSAHDLSATAQHQPPSRPATRKSRTLNPRRGPRPGSRRGLARRPHRRPVAGPGAGEAA